MAKGFQVQLHNTQLLDPRTCARLHEILSEPTVLRSSLPGAHPSLPVVPRVFLAQLQARMASMQLSVVAVHLEGGAAVSCICPDEGMRFNDLDLVFYLEGEDSSVLHLAREALVRTLCDSLHPAALPPSPSPSPSAPSPAPHTPPPTLASFSSTHLAGAFPSALQTPLAPHTGTQTTLAPAPAPADLFALAQQFITKMFLKQDHGDGVGSGDLWALCSLEGCDGRRGIDVKSIVRCRRPYQFSVDSFFIDVSAYACGAIIALPLPPTLAGSHYGTMAEATDHVRRRVIAMHSAADPATVFGGGLFKYSHLLSQGYRPAPSLSVVALERAMCARFCSDYPPNLISRYSGMLAQAHSLNNYLRTHFPTDSLCPSALLFLTTLRGVFLRSCPLDRCQQLLDVLNASLVNSPAPILPPLA